MQTSDAVCRENAEVRLVVIANSCSTALTIEAVSRSKGFEHSELVFGGQRSLPAKSNRGFYPRSFKVLLPAPAPGLFERQSGSKLD